MGSPSSDRPSDTADAAGGSSILPSGSSTKRHWGGWGFLLKAATTLGLLFWLSRSGSLDSRSLAVLVSSAPVLAATIGVWLAVAAFLNTVRWRWVLRMVGAEVPWGRAFGLQVMAQFFNVAVPGNVGGDVMKNYYVMPSRKGAIVCAALVERYVGLLGLFAVALLFQFSPSLPPRAASVFLLVDVVVLGMACGLVALVAFVRRLEGHPDRSDRSDWAARLMGLAREFRPANIGRGALISLLISALMHLVCIGYFVLIASTLRGTTVPISLVAPIYPLGMLTVVLPISVAGLGVGHLAFEELFAWVGLTGGANTFNVFIVGALAPSLVGIIPYLLMKRSAGDVAAQR